LETMLAATARAAGDVLERTTDAAGDVIRSRKGDFVLTVDPRLARGADLRVVIEAKDRQLSARQARIELQQARANRGACVALAVFTPAHAPLGAAPFDVRGEDVYCVIDPEAPEPAVLEAAVRLARLLALATLHDSQAEVDTEALCSTLGAIRGEMEAVRRLKVQLTSIGNTARAVSDGLDQLREQVLNRLTAAEAEVRIDRA
ncbi:MAG: hypothetical protein M3253_07680, partial [Chloroflexota bacterium]|nr:hypothetical protein [Chloroflexota bacterium]